MKNLRAQDSQELVKAPQETCSHEVGTSHHTQLPSMLLVLPQEPHSLLWLPCLCGTPPVAQRTMSRTVSVLDCHFSLPQPRSAVRALFHTKS